jgi:hypothetical protein
MPLPIGPDGRQVNPASQDAGFLFWGHCGESISIVIWWKTISIIATGKASNSMAQHALQNQFPDIVAKRLTH